MNSSDVKHYTLHELIILGREEEFTERLSKEQDVDSTAACGKSLRIQGMLEKALKK